jgi:hypothetical protein
MWAECLAELAILQINEGGNERTTGKGITVCRSSLEDWGRGASSWWVKVMVVLASDVQTSFVFGDGSQKGLFIEFTKRNAPSHATALSYSCLGDHCKH